MVGEKPNTAGLYGRGGCDATMLARDIRENGY
jgi:hypothetical protein